MALFFVVVVVFLLFACHLKLFISAFYLFLGYGTQRKNAIFIKLSFLFVSRLFDWQQIMVLLLWQSTTKQYSAQKCVRFYFSVRQLRNLRGIGI
jgi:hypothetical protein